MRETLYLRTRYRAILVQVGLIAALLGLLMLAPLAALPMAGDAGPGGAGAGPATQAIAYVIPALVLILGGLGLHRLLDPGDVSLSLSEGGVVVLLSWLLACLASAVPFMVVEGLDLTRAVFESVSGWTTTGLSVVDVTSAQPTTLLWRSVMQLAGGAGLAILMLAAMVGSTSPALSAAEGRAEQLAPHVLESARLVVRIYAGYAVAGILGLRAAGMGWFDAVNHAFSAISTGGFSTRPESIGYWQSPAVEGVTLVLMVLGSLNFVTVWLLLRGRARAFGGNGEVRFMAIAVPVCAVLLLGLTCAPLYSSFPKACRVALFETVTALTTTGYSTVGYGDWNAFGILIIIVLMLIGGATCSTAGGMKQHRVYILWRSLVRELRRPQLPRTAVIDDSIREGEDRVPIGDARVRVVAAFVFLYLLAWFTGAAVLAAYGCRLQDALFEFASTLGTVGLSVGVTGAGSPDPVLWTQTAGMLLGRLEFFVIFAGATKLVRDTARMVRRGP